MTEETNSDRAFELLSEESRVARSARMLPDDTRLEPSQRVDIAARVCKWIDERGLSQKAVAREVGISTTTISEVLRNRYKGKTSDAQLVKLHNWLELAARRETVCHNREFVETSVAREILQVVAIVAETCKIGVVFGPAQIGKSFTLKAIEGDQRFGDPVLVRVDESMLRPFALCRAIAERFDVSTYGTFDVVFGRLVRRLVGTKRVILFDEAERLTFKALETLRDLHDETGCGLLLCGKPSIYERMGFRKSGDFNEVTDQLAARVVIRRDLTLRTRGDNPEPLFSLADIRKLIDVSQLRLAVTPDGVRWLQERASNYGTGGIGRALVCLYLAYKVAFVKGEGQITSATLDSIEDLSMGYEDHEAVAEAVQESCGLRRVV
jgi:DNA transposition AAA+ family ATPase